VMMVGCAALDLCWPVIERGAGGFFKSYLWDFAGSWPICRMAGLDLRSLRTGAVMDVLDLKFFEGKGSRTWKIKDHLFLSNKLNFSYLQKRLQLRHSK
jgi:fructose-1,6-bisphosphatase/inositol monophosphatase family enzyme